MGQAVQTITPARRSSYGSTGRTIRASTVRRVTNRRGPYWKASVKKIVRDTLSRQIEIKNVQLDANRLPLYYPTNSNFPINNIFRLTPGTGNAYIPQGAAQGQRVGNQINTKKLMFNFILTANAFNNDTNSQPQSQFVRVVLFYERDFPMDIPNPTANFFQAGSSSAGIEGNLTDIMATINSDVYVKLAERTFKIGWAHLPGTVAENAAPYNNDFKQAELVKWDITKYVPKRIQFSDNGSDPTTRGVYAIFMPAPAQGNQPTSSIQPLNLQWWTAFDYTDC